MNFEAIDLNKIKTFSIKKRKSKVKVEDFSKVFEPDDYFENFISSFPNILTGKDIRSLTDIIVTTVRSNGEVVLMLGAHVIKCGLSTIIIDLIENKVVTSIALNGAGGIHDFEIGVWGETSEDVASGLKVGKFGIWEETGRLMNETISEGKKDGIGLGEALGKKIVDLDTPYKKYSLLAKCYKAKIPCSVHVAFGTDIIHYHPTFDGGITGEMTLTDFKIFAKVISRLEGGVVMNIGSCVMLPEVFLKALNCARNLGHRVEKFTACNFDQIEHYRPMKNVCERPTATGGKSFSIIGRHEIVIPLLAGIIKHKLSRSS